MNTTHSNISTTIINKISDLVEFVFLMGSAETERFNEQSDIDIAVYWKLETTDEHKRKILFELQDLFGRDVDLVSLSNIDDIFAMQVLDKGRILINNNQGLLLQWKVEKMSKYPDFKFSRKIIEENILNRKKYV